MSSSRPRAPSPHHTPVPSAAGPFCAALFSTLFRSALFLAALLSAALFPAGCATRLTHPLPPLSATLAQNLPTLDQLEARLADPHLSEQELYLHLSALLGLARASGRFDLADRVLEQVRARAPDARLSRLAGLWWADNALYAGRHAEAERRYRELIELEDRLGAQSPLLLVGSPLRDWLAVQAGQAIALQGYTREAALWLEQASTRALGLELAMRRRGALLAKDIGDRTLARRLAKKLPVRFQPRPARVYGITPPPVRPLEALSFKAPWEPRLGQRAGALGANPFTYLSFALKGLRRGRPDSPCGEAAAGYYYGTGSHRARARSGRDAYAVDFAGPGLTGTPWGQGSFGIQLRAAGEGIVSYSYYGTRTHRSYRSPGPVPDNNAVALLHIAPGLSLVDLLLGPKLQAPPLTQRPERSQARPSPQAAPQASSQLSPPASSQASTQASPQASPPSSPPSSPRSPRSDEVAASTGKESRNRARGARFLTRRGLDLRDAWDYQTQYHHLVGLEDPCPASSLRGRSARQKAVSDPGCIAFPGQVSVGQYVWRGSPLGYEDASGRAMMDHLHFQIDVTCRPDGADCPPDYRYRSAGRSVPMVLEGRHLTPGDMGLCLVSTNAFELAVDQNQDGLPDVLEPLP